MKVFTRDDFNGHNTIHNGLVLVDFYADWCGPCKMLTPILEDLSNDRKDVLFAKINVDEFPDVAAAFKVTTIPTMLIFNNGKLIANSLGFQPKNSIERILNAIEI
jgi:thioredoxin 1